MQSKAKQFRATTHNAVTCTVPVRKRHDTSDMKGTDTTIAKTSTGLPFPPDTCMVSPHDALAVDRTRFPGKKRRPRCVPPPTRLDSRHRLQDVHVRCACSVPSVAGGNGGHGGTATRVRLHCENASPVRLQHDHGAYTRTERRGANQVQCDSPNQWRNSSDSEKDESTHTSQIPSHNHSPLANEVSEHATPRVKRIPQK